MVSSSRTAHRAQGCLLVVAANAFAACVAPVAVDAWPKFTQIRSKSSPGAVGGRLLTSAKPPFAESGLNWLLLTRSGLS
jgi:hypothetical protein